MTLSTAIIMDNTMWPRADSAKGKIAALLGLEGVYTMTAVAASVQGCGLITEQMKINQNLCVKYTMEVANKF